MPVAMTERDELIEKMYRACLGGEVSRTHNQYWGDILSVVIAAVRAEVARKMIERGEGDTVIYRPRTAAEIDAELLKLYGRG